ncbi:conserved hypothetical protein [Methanosalsum zhilinae DSM 4017]|uniref:DUF1059 domain-containing protein n=1 Tax=Methanosalsum zhilinae (strain DSM 4017 / NBRC 107636 / OCM 62 / WeN5) TaxID=679901 RepID=F7XL24_METZD|nr:DUF1059 domain-containing protein [Methanosalsum zhilinae]AEH60732.1 conserved hypothetical protein [Methanosalsum zhilinae DSM 4017]
MKILRCRDLGFNCGFITTGYDADELKKNMQEHIETIHRESFEKMDEDDKEDIKYRMDFLLSRGCGCGAL